MRLLHVCAHTDGYIDGCAVLRPGAYNCSIDTYTSALLVHCHHCCWHELLPIAHEARQSF